MIRSPLAPARYVWLLLLAAWLFAAPAAAQDGDESGGNDDSNAPAYRLEQVAGDVYRFVAGNYRSAILVAEGGTLVTDPVSTAAATWLRGELADRFPDAPVRYVVYSHNHPDHTYGGEVFAGPGVTFVAHELAREDLVWTKAQTQIPDLTFSDEETIRLGEHAVTLRYHGPNNGYGSVSMHFAPANVLFVTDWITLGRLPYRDLQGYDVHGMIRSTRAVLDLDFDTFIGGHADVGTKADVRRYLGYLEALYDAVLTRMQAGQPLEQIKAEVRLPEYDDYRMYDEWLALNVEGVYKMLRDRSYLLMRPDVPAPDDSE